MTLSAPARNPRRVHAARVASAARWSGHPTRTIRLAELDEPAARLIRALVAMARAEQAARATEIPQ